MTTLNKLQPHRTMYLGGFDRRGAATSLHNASANGFTVSGCWADQADFANLMLFDADDVFGHLYTSRYLPDFSLAGVTLDFDLALTNCQNPISSKYQSVPWGALSYITRSVTGGAVSEVQGTTPLHITSTTGAGAASCTYTVNGAPVAYDRVQLCYLGNVMFDVTLPGSSSVTFSYWNYLGTGYDHTITVGANTYSHVQLSTDGSGDIAIALANLVNAAPDANATATASCNDVILTPKLNTGAVVTCSASDGNGGGLLLERVGTDAVNAWVASELAAQINAQGAPLTATASGASFTVSAPPGADGNGIQLLEMHKTATCYLSPAGASKLTGGADPTSIHVHLDFSALGLASVRQLWLTFAPALNYDSTALLDGSGLPRQTLVPYAPTWATEAQPEWSAVVSNWTVSDPGGVTALKLAGPGSVTVTSGDSWAARAGSGWGQVAGWYAGGFAWQSAHAGDTVTVTYSCQSAHNLYLGTAASTAGGTFNVAADGGTAVPVTDANHYQLTTLVSGTAFTVAARATTLIDLQTTQCNFNPATVTAYLTSCYLQAAGLVPWLQLGEMGWWFYSLVNGLAIGYASYTSPISIGTQSPHGLSSGQGVIDCGVQGNTAANGDFTATVTGPTHFTLGGSSGNGNYVAGTGTVSGGGMAYYDAYTAAAAATTLGRALASFSTQDDDPSVNSYADSNFLRGLVYAHMHAIAQAVKTAYAGAKVEWLLPMDTNKPTVYWNAGYPYPQGGRMNSYVNIPSQYKVPNGDIDRLKLEALSWGASYLNLDLAKAAMAYGSSVLSYPQSATAYLVPWFNGACAWTKQYLGAVNSGIPLICFWAVDHLCLLSWPLPLPANQRRAYVF